MKNIKKAFIAVLAVIIAVIAFGGCAKKDSKKADAGKKAKFVKVDVALTGAISKKVVVTSEVDSFKEVTHITETGGDVKDVYVVNGKWVKEGDKIVEFSNEQIEMAYSQAKAQYLSAKANYDRAKKFSKDQMQNNLVKAERGLVSAKMSLEKAKKGTKQEQIDQSTLSVQSAKSNYDNAKTLYENNKKLYDKNLISEQQYLQIKTQYEVADNNYKTAQKQLDLVKKGADDEDIKTMEASVKDADDSYKLTKKMVDEETWKYDLAGAEAGFINAEAGLKLAEKRFKDLTVYAKTSGVIANLAVTEKNKAGAGTPLFSIINNDDMIVKVGLTEKEIIGIQKFNKAEVYVESIDSYYDGTVYEVNPVADSKTRKYSVKIKIKNTEHTMKKGMFAKVTIMVGEHEGMLVPKKAIVISGIDAYIFKIEDGIAKKVSVEQGDEDDKDIEIKSDEITEGDNIAIEGQFLLNDGDKVKISDSEVK